MGKVNKNLSEAALLRQKAEEQFNKKHSAKKTLFSTQSEIDTLKLIQELEVHQIELEMQNEELKLAINKTATATALYDFAPAGYFTIHRDECIMQLNLNGARMLGSDRSRLVNKKFSQFITAETWPVFNKFFLKVFEANSKQTCEVRLAIDRNPSIYVHLEGIISEDDQKCLVTAVDITESKQAEETLRRSEERHRFLADNASDVIWTMDLNGRYTYVSPSVEKLRGYTVAEVMQQSMDEVLTPDSAAIAHSSIRQALEAIQTGQPIPEFNSEMELRCADGSTVWADVTSSAMLNETGKFIGILGVSRNITAHKLAEEALRRSEERHRLLADNASDVIWTMDLNGRYTYVSPSVEKLRGYTAAEVMQQSMEEVLTPESAAIANFKLMEAYEAIQAGQPLHEFNSELEQRCADGSTVWTDVTSSPMFNKVGEFIGILGVSRNITERKKAEDALHESEEKHRIILDESSDPIFTFNPDGQYRYANKAFADGVGRKMEDIIGRKIWDVFPKDEADKRFAAVKWVFANAEEKVIEVSVPRPDGDRWYITTVKPIMNEQGKVTTVICISKDITIRKQAEEAQREGEEKYRTLLELAPDAFVQGDSEGNFILVNNKAVELTGLSRDELLGMNMSDLFPSDIMNKRPLRYDLLKNGDTIITEREIVRKNGERIPVEMNSKAMPNHTYQCFMRDITDRIRADEKLRESEKRFRIMADTAPVLIWMSGTDKILNYFNKIWLDFTGRSMDQEVGNGWIERVHPDDLQLYLDTYSSSFDEQIPFKMESRLKRFDSEYRWMCVSGVPRISKVGKFYGYIGSCIDITERKVAEESLLESEARLRELNATKDKFFSIIGHDLKNPFNSIIGFSNLLARQIQEKDYDGIAKYSMIIQNSSQRAMNLLMNLLEWSRSQTGKMEFNPEPIEVVALINEIAVLLNDSAQQKSITIYTEIPDKANVVADRPMIGTILRNLISNAIKFTNPGGEIVISTLQKPSELVVTVADNGIGIKKEVVGMLFRIDASYKTMGTQNEIGTGLGLLLCKEFEDKHGGKIWVESEHGKGSKFCFTIPENFNSNAFSP